MYVSRPPPRLRVGLGEEAKRLNSRQKPPFLMVHRIHNGHGGRKWRIVFSIRSRCFWLSWLSRRHASDKAQLLEHRLALRETFNSHHRTEPPSFVGELS